MDPIQSVQTPPLSAVRVVPCSAKQYSGQFYYTAGQVDRRLWRVEDNCNKQQGPSYYHRYSNNGIVCPVSEQENQCKVIV